MVEDALIEMRDLKTHFHTDRGVVRAVDGISLIIRPERTLGVVGESGSGKSIMARSIMGLVPRPPARVSGEIFFKRPDGSVVNMATLNPKGQTMRDIRGGEIAMIFQEPMTSLNPVYTIGNQIAEAVTLHQGVGATKARARAIEMLALVGIPAPEKRVDNYPHQLSGGMRQRAMIAMALSCNPGLLIADEPTTALDVTIQAQILALMKRLQSEFKSAIMLITHDLGVVAGVADEVAVMYLGQVMEYGSVRSVFKKRYHPYTQGLLQSIPTLGMPRDARLKPIEGMVPDPRFMPTGCRFKDRCPYRMPICDKDVPMFEPEPGHQARCFLHDPEVKQGGGETRPLAS
jgi:oligopeptide/dipeptide ABC transporter ATP-binding protein